MFRPLKIIIYALTLLAGIILILTGSRLQVNGADTAQQTDTTAKPVPQITIPTLPDRGNDPLLEAANFHIYAKTYNGKHGTVHTNGNVATNYLDSTANFGNSHRPAAWQRTSYVQDFSDNVNGHHYHAKGLIFGSHISLARQSENSDNQLKAEKPAESPTEERTKSIVKYDYSSGGTGSENYETGAAIEKAQPYVNIEATLQALAGTSKAYAQSSEAHDFFDPQSKYVKKVGSERILDLTKPELDNKGSYIFNMKQSDLTSNDFQNDVLVIKMNSTQQVIFNMISDDSGQFTEVSDSKPKTSIVPIGRGTDLNIKLNVDGYDITTDPEEKENYLPPTSIIWNIVPYPHKHEDELLIYDTKNRFFGAILAPTLTVQSSGAFEGTMVAETYRGSTQETHSWNYNPRDVGYLKVAKQVDSEANDRNQDFDFIVDFENLLEGNFNYEKTIQGSTQPTTGKLTVHKLHEKNNEGEIIKTWGQAKFALKHNESITIELPEGVTAVIKEVGQFAGQFETNVNNQSGKISQPTTIMAKETKYIQYLNWRGTKPVHANIEFDKTFNHQLNEQLAAETEFTLYQTNNPEYALSADYNGNTFSFKGLAAGEYILKETKTPTGYQKMADLTFTVDKNGNCDFEAKTNNVINNEPVTNPGKLNFIKYRQTNHLIFPDVTFHLKQNGNVIHTQVSNGNGEVVFTDLAVGTYELVEETPKGYQAMGPWQVTVDAQGNTKVAGWPIDHQLINQLKEFELTIQKKKVNNETLEGAKFALKNQSGTEYQVQSLGNGKFHFSGLTAPGEYTLTETETPKGYKTIDPIKFTLDNNGDINIFNKDNTKNPNITLTSDTNANQITFDVINEENDPLPVTGGHWRGLLTVLGVAAALIAGTYLISRKVTGRKAGR